MAATKRNPGCNCCGSNCQTCIPVQSVCSPNPTITGATVTISSGGTTVATGTTSGVVTSVTLSSHGSGYTSVPTVAFSGGGGSGAAGTAVLSTTNVVSLTLNAGGSGFSQAPNVIFSGGGGSGATATAALTPAPISTITLTGGGSGYTGAPTVAISGGGGTGATATATVAGGVVTGLTLTAGGSGYTSVPTVAFSGGGGSGATAIAKANTSIATLTLTGGGSGYTSTPTVSFSGGGGGTGATATATIGTFTVASVTVTTPGSGYTSSPTVSFSGGGGSGAAGTGNLTVEFCCTIPSAGTYTVVTSAPGFITDTSTLTLACNATHAPIQLSPSICTVCITPKSPCQGSGVTLPGGYATVTVTGPGGSSGATDGSGKFCLSLGVGSYTYSVTAPRFNTFSGSFTITGGQFGSICSPAQPAPLMVVSSGYVCTCGSPYSCLIPISKTLFLTDATYGGPVTLNYTIDGLGNQFWVGSQTAAYPECDSAAPPHPVICPAATTTITYTLWNSPCISVDDFNLAISYSCNSSTHCPGGTSNCNITPDGSGGCVMGLAASPSCPTSLMLSYNIIQCPSSWPLYCSSSSATVTE